MSSDKIPAKRQRLDDSPPVSESNDDSFSDSEYDDDSVDNFSDDDDRSWTSMSPNDDDDSDDIENYSKKAKSTFLEKLDQKRTKLEAEIEEEKRKFIDTPLHLAVKSKNIELIKFILDSEGDVDVEGEKRKTPLLVAIETEFLPAVEILLQHGANISAKNICKSINVSWTTPLHLAAQKNRLDLLELLLTKQIDVSELKKNYDIVLNNAVRRKNFKLILQLAGSSDDGNKVVKEVLSSYSMQQLSEMGYSEDLTIPSFGKQVDINEVDSYGKTLLFLAVKNNNEDMVKFLLDNGAEINTLIKGNYDISQGTALHAAVKLNNENIVSILLDHENCDVNAKTFTKVTPIFIATAENNLKMVKKLIERNAEFNIYSNFESMGGYTPLHVAVANGLLEMAKYFLRDLKMDVNSRTEDDETALIIATRRNFTDKLDMIKLLLDHGANIDHYPKEEVGYSALFIAVTYGDIEIVDLLLNRGANLKINTSWQMLLSRAVCSKNINVVKRLLECGADIECNKMLKSPLLQAAEQNSKEFFLLLIDEGADINGEVFDKWSYKYESIATVVCYKCKDTEMLEMVLNLGADINRARLHREFSNPILTVLRKHLIKLKAAGLFVKEKYLKWVSHGKQVEKFMIKCSKEVEVMKKEKIGESNVYYQDLLVKNLDQLVMFAENKGIEESLKLDELKTKFPVYAEMLVGYFKRGQVRSQLMIKAGKTLKDFFFGLPHDCIRQILKRLSNEDLYKCSRSRSN